MSYGIATSSAIGMGLLIRKALQKPISKATGSKLVAFNALTTFFAVGSAGFLNAFFMRQTEIKSGIDVLD